MRPNTLILNNLQSIKQPFYTVKATFLHILCFLKQPFYTVKATFLHYLIKNYLAIFIHLHNLPIRQFPLYFRNYD
jgi:hypothetical protein